MSCYWFILLSNYSVLCKAANLWNWFVCACMCLCVLPSVDKSHNAVRDFWHFPHVFIINLGPTTHFGTVFDNWFKHNHVTHRFLGLAPSPYETSTVSLSVSQSVRQSQKFSYFPSLDFSDFLQQVSL